ncbi:MAG: GTPase ObgE [Elusimicrobia bacterium]|nr:GTPase ObgE [Elusimicrobiota bacterium]
MNFVDKVRVYAQAGKGGDGCLSFLREKFRPFGGPDGGDGGKGGDILLIADANYRTLLDFSLHPHVRAEEGGRGKGSLKAGADGRDIVLRVPAGTMVLRGGKLVADLARSGEKACVARGGRGGRGNAAFKSHRNTAPRIYEKGEPGEEAELELELRLIADIGLVGFPNAGKSTLLSRVSNARPKIADYPFTTLAPNLGLVRHKDESFVLADLPGLIEGAHEGRGLGGDFLRHVERTRLLIHLVDPSGFKGVEPLAGIRVIEEELRSYDRALSRGSAASESRWGAASRRLAAKPRFLAVNKLDLPGAEEALRRVRGRYPKRKVFALSAVTGEGVSKLLDAALRALARMGPPPPEGRGHEAAVLAGRCLSAPGEGAASGNGGGTGRSSMLKLERGFEVERAGPGAFKVFGSQVERLAAMSDFALPESLRRFQNILRRVGVDRALKRAGVREGDTVRIGKIEFEWQDQEAAQGS